jgi:predicted nucleic acid-binding protein
MNTKIIVDTCVWIEFFRNQKSDLTRHLSTLLREQRVVMIGMIMAEILQGIKDPKEAQLVKKNLEKLPYFEMTRDVWQKAGEISVSLRKKGISIPLSDLIVASCALSESYSVFTIDPHFDKVPGLKRYRPS